MPRSLSRERRDHILKQLGLWGVVRTAELSAQLGVSERTLQRDLDTLAATGTVERVHGGAVAPAAAEGPARLRLGLVVPTKAYYYEQIIEGVLESASTLNAQVIIGNYDYREELETARLRRVSELDLDGLLVTVDYDGHGYGQLQSLPLPMVLIERPWHPLRLTAVPDRPGAAPPIDHVCSDHSAGVVLGLDHLRSLGHRSIYCLIRRTPTAVGLLRGLLHAGPGHDRPADRLIIRELDRAAEPLEAGHRWLDELVTMISSGLVTGALVHTDHDALAVHRALGRAGIAVPEQASLLSYDGVIIEDSAVPLSAVAPQRRWIGRLACETLVDRLRSSGRRSHAVRPSYQLSLPPELVLRGTTAPRAS